MVAKKNSRKEKKSQEKGQKKPFFGFVGHYGNPHHFKLGIIHHAKVCFLWRSDLWRGIRYSLLSCNRISNLDLLHEGGRFQFWTFRV